MRRWELSALPPQSPGKAGLEIEFNHQWSMIESITPMQWNLHKTPQMCQGLKSFWVGEHINVLGGWWALKGRGSSAPYHPSLALCTSSIWLFLSYNLYNKLANLSKVLSWVLWVVLADSWTEGVGIGVVMRTPEFIATWKHSGLGLAAGIWKGSSLVGWALNLWGLC